MDDDYLLMDDEAIFRAAEEAEREDAWYELLGLLVIEVEEAPDRAVAIAELARLFPSLANADGIEP